MQTGRVVLDVGGTRFTTSRETLCSAKDSMLERMFSGQVPAKPEPDGSYFIDRDPRSFEAILNALRRGMPPRKPKRLDPDEWRNDLEFFGVSDREMLEEREEAAKKRKLEEDEEARRKKECRLVCDYVKLEMKTMDTRMANCYLPLDPADSSPLLPQEFRKIEWGNVVYSEAWIAELERLGISLVVKFAETRTSITRARALRFPFIDGIIGQSGQTYHGLDDMRVAIVEFELLP